MYINAKKSRRSFLNTFSFSQLHSNHAIHERTVGLISLFFLPSTPSSFRSVSFQKNRCADFILCHMHSSYNNRIANSSSEKLCTHFVHKLRRQQERNFKAKINLQEMRKKSLVYVLRLISDLCRIVSSIRFYVNFNVMPLGLKLLVFVKGSEWFHFFNV